MLQIVHVKRTQRVIVLYNSEFERVLEPGTHYLWGFQRELLTLDLTSPIQEVVFADPIPEEAPGQELITVSDTERLLVSVDGMQRRILGPGRYRLWEGLGEVDLRRFDLLERPAPLPGSDRIELTPAPFNEAVASADQALVLFRDGRPVEELNAGRYRAWHRSPWSLGVVHVGLQGLEVAAQDLVTADQIPVRVKPSVSFRVVDPIRFTVERTQAGAQVYTAVQLALRELVAGNTLEQLLADRSAFGDSVLARARELLPDVGLRIDQAAVKDVILPGEVKEILSRVTLARKEAEAHAIRRREEVAATRQLANTAKLLEKNPILTRLKELEALGELVSRIDRITLVGGPGDLVPKLLTDAARE